MKQDGRQPGDLILDRYMPDASADDREAAREVLREFAIVFFGIVRRRVRGFRDELDSLKGN